MNKIFQIGFNKCGTFSFCELFSKFTEPKILSVHWDLGRLALKMQENLLDNKNLLVGYEQYVVYTDMETCIYNDLNNTYKYHFMFKYFDLLDKQYPNSKFILNTRPVDNWISSRLNHTNGYKMINEKVVELNPPEPYYITHLNMYRIQSIPTLVNIWRVEWNDHHKKVKQYFKHRPKDLLIFDIENDSFEKIVEFFKDEHISFTTNSLPVVNKTQVTA